MASVDNGIIVRTEPPTWLIVKPRCPHCGYMEESSWNYEHVGIPRSQYHNQSNSHTCSKCRKGFRITAYYG